MAKVSRTKSKAYNILEKSLRELDGKVGKTGWFASSHYANGTPVAYVAAIQEYGYAEGHIPPRPFMRPTIIKQQKAWREIMFKGAKEVLKGKYTITKVMEDVSFQAEGDVAKTIASIWTPKLADSTIARRLSKRKDKTITKSLAKPLVDSAIMINTLTHVVEDDPRK